MKGKQDNCISKKKVKQNVRKNALTNFTVNLSPHAPLIKMGCKLGQFDDVTGPLSPDDITVILFGYISKDFRRQ